MRLVWAALCAAFFVLGAARAEMAPNFPPQHHDWLHRQFSPTGVKCCDPGDCWVVVYRIRLVEAGSGLSGYQARLGDDWIDIPALAVTRVADNPVGAAILCISPTRHVWCFLPGPES